MELNVLRRWWPVALVVALLAVAALAAGNSTIGASRVPPATDTIPLVPEYPEHVTESQIPVEPRDAAESTRPEIPRWLTTAALVVLAVVLAVALGIVARVLLRGAVRRTRRALPQRRAGRSSEGTTREVVAALDAGLVDLDDAATDPRTAVIACWVRLEEAAGAAGVPRRTGDTPTDLVTRLLRGDSSTGVPVIVSADVLAGFAHVYREARYATRPVDTDTRDQARNALRRLRTELTTERSEVTA
ncbi:DUF4129 domain-containing protein [Micromonospora sp. NPDC000207]|uniref:DUF4129 domain-containing protein n=1 Tax=Micromonospora sp. NPDC000207 TaxID=3154246 RepID=UPI0033204635